MEKKDFQKFVNNLFLRVSGDLFGQGLKFASIPVLVHALSKDEFGIWGQINPVLFLVPLLIGANLGIALVRFLATETPQRRLIVLRSAILVTIANSLIVIIAAFIFQQPISSLLFADPQYKQIVVIAAIWLSIRAISILIVSELRSKEDIRIITFMQLANGIVLAASAIVVMILHSGISIFCIITMIGEAIILIPILFKEHIFDFSTPFENPFKVLKTYFRFCLPLNLHHIIVNTSSYADRFIIVHLLGLKFSGWYFIAINLAQLINAALSPLNFVLLPRIVKLWNTGDKIELKKYIRLGCSSMHLAGIPMSFIIILTFPFLSKAFFNSVSLEDSTILLLSLATMLDMMLNNYKNILFLTNKISHVVYITAVLSVVSIGLYFLLIPQFNLTGAALTRFIVASLIIVIYSTFIRKNIISFEWLILFKVLIICIVFFIPLYYLRNSKLRFALISSSIFMSGYLASLYFFNVIPFFTEHVKSLVSDKLRKPFSWITPKYK